MQPEARPLISDASDSPANALRAIIHAQTVLATPPAGAIALRLKAGPHFGPCIAVTLNDRLDYIGSTVNIAARLEGLSTGDDVILTGAVHADPEVSDLLVQPDSSLTVEHFDVLLRGFGEEYFTLWRVRHFGGSVHAL